MDVRPEEKGVFTGLFLHAVLNGIALVFFETPANTLFLVQIGASALPWVYVATAVVLLVIGRMITRLEQRHRKPVVLRGVIGFLLATVLLLAVLGVAVGGRWVTALIMVWKDVLWVLLALEFWALAGMLLDLRQGKRLFGAIAGGQILALMVGGVAVSLLSKVLPTEALFLVSAAALLGSAGILVWIVRTHAEVLEAAEEETSSGSLRAPKRTRQSPYFKLFVVVSGLSVVVGYLVDFLFLDRIQVAIPQQQVLSQFFGFFFVGLGLLQVFSSFLLVGPLLTRVGLAGALLILPTAEVLGAGGIVMASFLGVLGVAVALAVVTKLADEVFRATLEMPSQRILYQAFPSSVRFRVQGLVETGVEPLAVGVSGLLILGFTTTPIPTALGVAVLLAGLAMTWLLRVARLGAEYPRALGRTLASQRLNPTPLQWNDPATLRVVREALRSRIPGEVIYGLQVLERLDEEELERALLEVLSHPHSAVRRYALERIEELRIDRAGHAVLARAEGEEDPTVLAAAGRCLAVLRGTEPVRVLELLRDLRPRVRRETMIGLLRNGSPEALEAAEPLVHEMANSHAVEERALVAEALGTGGGPFAGVLADLFDDPEAPARAAAAAAAGRMADPRFLPLLVEALRDPDTRTAAAGSLVLFGEEAVPATVEVLDDEESSSGARRRAARVLGRIGGSGAEALFERMGYPEEEVRVEVLSALAKTGFRAPEGEEDRVWDRVRDELDDAQWTLETIQMVGTPDQADLLEDSLEHEVRKNIQRVLSLLALVLPRDDVLQAATGIDSRSSALRAQAVELLETLVPREHRDGLLRVLERPPVVDSEGAERDAAIRRRLDEAILRPPHLSSSWARVAALYRVSRHPDPDHLEVLERALESEDPTVRETALWAGARVDASWMESRLPAFTEDPAPGVRRVARSLLGAPQLDSEGRMEPTMLLTVERVVILKSVNVFQEIPEEYLAELAASLDEMEVQEGEMIMRKGEPGSEMYIIVEGRMLVHDGDRHIAELGSREVVGEMAALDPEVRSASVTALEDSFLFRVSQRMLSQLMAERSEVAQGIIHVLCRRLRKTVM